MDHLQNDNFNGAKDAAALLAVCIEQATMDGGRLDVCLLLALSEDPPAGVFRLKSTTNYAKARAFAPLAEQRWVTIALAYIKEMDLIATKRSDATSSKGDNAATFSAPPTKAPKKHAKGKQKGSDNTKADAVE